MPIGTTIKTIQDIMRKDAGVDGDAQRISQLVWMIFLKIFDDREAEKELLDDAYRSPIPARLRWRAWAKDPEGITGPSPACPRPVPTRVGRPNPGRSSQGRSSQPGSVVRTSWPSATTSKPSSGPATRRRPGWPRRWWPRSWGNRPRPRQ